MMSAPLPGNSSVTRIEQFKLFVFIQGTHQQGYLFRQSAKDKELQTWPLSRREDEVVTVIDPITACTQFEFTAQDLGINDAAVALINLLRKP